MNINQYQEKINLKFPQEKLLVLSYNGTRNIKKDSYTKIKCLSCNKVYSFCSGENAIRKSKKIICKECALKNKRFNDFKQKVDSTFVEDDLTIINFTKREQPCTIQCNKCGTIYDFTKAAYVWSKTRKYFCTTCFPLKKDIMNETKQKFLEFLERDTRWTLVQNIEQIHSKDLIQCKCNKCNEISQKTVYDYMRGKGCLNCSGKKLKTSKEFIQELDSDYELLSDYINANTKVLLKHKCGFVYKVTPHNYLSGKRCPQCMRKQSKGEYKIEKLLKEYNIDYEKEYPVEIDGHLLRFDFYLPDYNLFIEFQGIQHFEAIIFFGGEKRFKQQQYYDELKRKNYNVVEINYLQIDDIDNILLKTLKFNDYPEREYIES